MTDYSIQVTYLNRSEIMKRLGPMANEKYGTKQMMTCLAKKLKNEHPIHNKVQLLPNLFQLCSSLSLQVPKRDNRKMKKLIVDHFFETYPDAPLTNLNRVLEEDAYFAEPKSIGIIIYVIFSTKLPGLVHTFFALFSHFF